jgi:nitroreductase/dihydropteridine reductase
MNIIEIIENRYSTKVFDPNKTISAEDFEKVKLLLQKSPSSTNLQPWHFILADNEQGKKRITKGTQGVYQFNEAKILDASHVIVFCAKTGVDKEHMDKVSELEEKDGRYASEEIMQKIYNARNYFANMHKYDFKDQQHWLEKQVYLNIGNLILGVATLGIDSLIMEGIDFKALDEEFALREQGHTSVAVVSLGYRSENDFNTIDQLPKSRFPQDEIFTIL